MRRVPGGADRFLGWPGLTGLRRQGYPQKHRMGAEAPDGKWCLGIATPRLALANLEWPRKGR
jgi:hypothetical protein